jgi:pimeloyl-ACP methyl ester carboxylesterase
MSDVEANYIQAELAFAAYATVRANNSDAEFRSVLENEAKMSQAQAENFVARYRVVDSFSNPNGSYAAVFENKQTGQRYLSVRGTDGGADIDDDVYLFVGVPSNLNPQYVSVENQVRQWAQNGTISPGITVTGHSLGGYLATALKSAFPGEFGATYTVNAPGLGGTIGSVGEFFQRAFGLSSVSSDVYDLRGSKGLSMIAGTGLHWGTPVPVEIESAPGLGLGNHSVARVSDSLAVQAMLAKLDPTVTQAKANQLFAAAGINDESIEKLLDGVRAVFTGASALQSNRTPINDRQALYANLRALTDPDNTPTTADGAFNQLAGKLQFQATHDASAARTDFAALLALQLGLPFGLKLSDSSAEQQLYAVHRQTYEHWLADTNLTQAQREAGQANFSENWCNDRAALLNWHSVANSKDIDTNTNNHRLTGQALTQPIYFEDKATGTYFTVSKQPLATTAQGINRVIFGNKDAGVAETIAGADANDRLYGNAGADTRKSTPQRRDGFNHASNATNIKAQHSCALPSRSSRRNAWILRRGTMNKSQLQGATA